MTVSLHAATIPSMLQIIGAAKAWLDKAEASNLNEEEVVEACLIEDMLPFKYQIKSLWVHSQQAIEGVKAGVFSPDFSEPPSTIASLRAGLEEAEAYLSALTEVEMEAFMGSDMRFEIGDKKLPFTGHDFLLTFTQPNFYFHAVTAYDILRAKGVEIGKLDFLGKMRLNMG